MIVATLVIVAMSLLQDKILVVAMVILQHVAGGCATRWSSQDPGHHSIPSLLKNWSPILRKFSKISNSNNKYNH